MHWRRKWQPTPGLLPGESQRQWSLVGYRLWGRTESDVTAATQQQQQQLVFHNYCPPENIQDFSLRDKTTLSLTDLLSELTVLGKAEDSMAIPPTTY